MKKLTTTTTLFLVAIPFTMFGMKDLQLRQRVDQIAEQQRMAPLPICSESTYSERFAQFQMTRQIASELVFQTPFLTSHQEQRHTTTGGELRPSAEVKPIQSGGTPFEASRASESFASQVLSYSHDHADVIQNPDTIPGFVYRDGWVFPFGTTPDMSHDPEMELIRKYADRHDVEFLVSKFASLRDELANNSSFIDGQNRYKLSRRLSLIVKQLRQDPVMRYLLQTYSATRLEGACFSLDQLRQYLNRTPSITMNGAQVPLDTQNIATIMRIAGQIITHRRDYRAEQTRYPAAAAAGGQLLEQSPVLARISGILYQSTHAADQHARTDLVSTTPTQVTNISPEVDARVAQELLQRVTVNPVTDFDGYMKQIGEILQDMEQKGLYTPETVTSFMKYFAIETAKYCEHIAQHPVETLQGFVQSNIELAKELGYLFVEAACAPDPQFASAAEMMEYATKNAPQIEKVVKLFDHVHETVPQMNREQWAQITARMFVDYLLIRGAGKGWNAATKFSIPSKVMKHPLFREVHTRFTQALSEHPELITPEGLTVKAPGGGVAAVESETSLLKRAAEKTGGSAKGGVAKQTSHVAEVATRFGSIEELIEVSGKLERLKHGVRQGWIHGDPRTIFENLAQTYGIKIHKNSQGVPFFELGKTIVHLTDSSANIPTLRISIDGKLYKIRFK